LPATPEALWALPLFAEPLLPADARKGGQQRC